MGAFFRAFWSRMGRNTGNRVSNAIFGDKWATPYRVAVGKNSKSPHRGRRSRSQPDDASYSYVKPTRSDSAQSAKSSNWLYWLGCVILFCGTYQIIITPNYEDIVLVIMLWIVAAVIYFVKRKK